MLNRTLSILGIALAFLCPSLVTSVYAQLDEPVIILRSSFVDSEGKVNVVGTVRNYAPSPVRVTVGLPLADKSTLVTEPFGRTIWPLTDAPFKFVLEKSQVQDGNPYIEDVEETEQVWHNTLLLTYDGMAVGEERAFVGKVKNVGSFDVRNVSVYAAVHSADHTLQLDSVRSNVIAVIRPGEEFDFKAVPDTSVRAGVLYYSCAGLDYDDPITTVKVGDGKILAYDLTAVAQVKNFRYENSTDSLAFGVKPYSPFGSDLTLKIPQQSINQTVSVFVDGNAYDSSVTGDGRTLVIDFFVPEGVHDVQVQGVRNIPELSYALVALAGLLTGLVSLRIFKGTIKLI